MGEEIIEYFIQYIFDPNIAKPITEEGVLDMAKFTGAMLFYNNEGENIGNYVLNEGQILTASGETDPCDDIPDIGNSDGSSGSGQSSNSDPSNDNSGGGGGSENVHEFENVDADCGFEWNYGPCGCSNGPLDGHSKVEADDCCNGSPLIVSNSCTGDSWSSRFAAREGGDSEDETSIDFSDCEGAVGVLVAKFEELKTLIEVCLGENYDTVWFDNASYDDIESIEAYLSGNCNDESTNFVLALVGFYKEGDWKEQLRQAVANGITTTAELTHKIYKRLDEISDEYPSSLVYINMVVDEFKEISDEVVDTNPQTLDWFDLFGIWLFELGEYPNQQDPLNGTETIIFDNDDLTTTSLKQQEGVNEARQMALDKIENNDLSNPNVSNPWSYGQGEFYDGMQDGNVATSFLGSYTTNITIVSNQDGSYSLQFSVSNPSTWQSATRLRIDNNGDGIHDGVFDNTVRGDPNTVSLGGSIYQIWTWTENL